MNASESGVEGLRGGGGGNSGGVGVRLDTAHQGKVSGGADVYVGVVVVDVGVQCLGVGRH